MEFNPDSSLLALLCLTADKKSMTILICSRSNWNWQVKQQIAGLDFDKTKGIRAMKWMFGRKQELFFIDGTGRAEFVEFHFKYQTSLRSFNRKNFKNLAYVCVADDCNLNLTPLGRFVMPPPMFEKQVKLPHFPAHLDMFGHRIVALLTDGQLVVVDCMDHENPQFFKMPEDISANSVSKIVVWENEERDQIKLAFVHPDPEDAKKDEILLFELKKGQDGKFGEPELSNSVSSPKVFSICVSASISHQGYARSSEFYSHNSYYTDVAQDNLNTNPLLRMDEGDEADDSNSDPHLVI